MCCGMRSSTSEMLLYVPQHRCCSCYVTLRNSCVQLFAGTGESGRRPMGNSRVDNTKRLGSLKHLLKLMYSSLLGWVSNKKKTHSSDHLGDTIWLFSGGPDIARHSCCALQNVADR